MSPSTEKRRQISNEFSAADHEVHKADTTVKNTRVPLMGLKAALLSSVLVFCMRNEVPFSRDSCIMKKAQKIFFLQVILLITDINNSYLFTLKCSGSNNHPKITFECYKTIILNIKIIFDMHIFSVFFSSKCST